jgi:uncharacterized membrane protein YoaK (UPF0700 family)
VPTALRHASTIGERMLDKLKFDHIEWILLLTAFAAGSVDVVSFASLGGVFASAMTGNFALLAYYVAQSDSQAAMGSVVALTGFVVGCGLGVLQRRGQAHRPTTCKYYCSPWRWDFRQLLVRRLA